MESAFQYLLMATTTTDGITWVIQALRCRLLPSLLRSQKWDSKSNHVCRDFILKRILPSYLVYRSVLRVMTRAMQDPEIAKLESHLPQDGMFVESWDALKSLLAERVEVKALFDEHGKHNQICASRL
jgi:hypothetical protein